MENLGYINNDPYCLLALDEIREGNEYKKEHSIHKDYPAFVLETKREYHLQTTVAFVDIERISKMIDHMMVCPPCGTLYDLINVAKDKLILC